VVQSVLATRQPQHVTERRGPLKNSTMTMTQPTRRNGVRRALVNHYMNAWSELPWDLSRAEPVRDWRVVVPVTGVDPYQWRGYEDPPRTVWFRPTE
jgi:hypothetical protein